MEVVIPKKVLQISYQSKNVWGYPIWNAINDAGNKDQKFKLTSEFRQSLGDIMLAISYRIDALPIIHSRLSKEISEIYKIVDNRDKSKDVYAFEGLSSDLIHCLLIDVDSFIFELRSCCELMGKLVKQVSRHFKKISPDIFAEEIPEGWIKSEWYERLRDLRVDVFHHTAPYVDVDISEEDKYDLLFPKRNIHDYKQDQEFFRLSDLNKIAKGFNEGIGILQSDLVGKITSLRVSGTHHVTRTY